MVFRKRWKWPVYFMLVVVMGCRGKLPDNDPDSDPFSDLVFQGKPAEKAVAFDLVGTWNLSNFVEPGDAPIPGSERWEETLQLSKEKERTWRDKNSGDTFTLHPAIAPQWLIRQGRHRRIFSVNEQRFGLLMMTESDGQKYMAVRTEGGEGKRGLP